MSVLKLLFFHNEGITVQHKIRSYRPSIEGLEGRQLLSTIGKPDFDVSAHVQTITKQRMDTAFNDAMTVLNLRLWVDLQTGKPAANVAAVLQQDKQLTIEYTNAVSSLQQVTPLKHGVPVAVQAFLADSEHILDTASSNEKHYVSSLDRLNAKYTRVSKVLNLQYDKALQAGDYNKADALRSESRLLNANWNLAEEALAQKFGLGG